MPDLIGTSVNPLGDRFGAFGRVKVAEYGGQIRSGGENQVRVKPGQGMSVSEACRQYGVL